MLQTTIIVFFLGGGLGQCPQSWVTGQRGCPTRACTSAMGMDGRHLRPLDHLFPPHHDQDQLHVVGVLKALDVHVLSACPTRPTCSPLAAMRAHEAAGEPLSTHAPSGPRRPAQCCQLRTAKELPLEDVPLEAPHGGLVVHQSRIACTHSMVPHHLPSQLALVRRHLVGTIHATGEKPKNG